MGTRFWAICGWFADWLVLIYGPTPKPRLAEGCIQSFCLNLLMGLRLQTCVTPCLDWSQLIYGNVNWKRNCLGCTEGKSEWAWGNLRQRNATLLDWGGHRYSQVKLRKPTKAGHWPTFHFIGGKLYFSYNNTCSWIMWDLLHTVQQGGSWNITRKAVPCSWTHPAWEPRAKRLWFFTNFPVSSIVIIGNRLRQYPRNVMFSYKSNKLHSRSTWATQVKYVNNRHAKCTETVITIRTPLPPNLNILRFHPIPK